MTNDWRCPECGTVNIESHDECAGCDYQLSVGKDRVDLPTEARLRLDQAYDYEENDLFEDALRECEMAVQLAPGWAEAHNLRGIILEEVDRRAEAIAAYREAICLDPAFDEAHRNLLEAEGELREEEAGASRLKAAPSVKGKRKRPRNITAVCYLYWFSASVLMVGSVISAVLGFGPYLSGATALSQMSEEILDLLPICGLSGAGGALAIFIALVGRGLWQLNKRARTAAIVVSGLIVAVNLVTTFIALLSGQVTIPHGVIWHGLSLGVLLSEKTKAAFTS